MLIFFDTKTPALKIQLYLTSERPRLHPRELLFFSPQDHFYRIKSILYATPDHNLILCQVSSISVQPFLNYKCSNKLDFCLFFIGQSVLRTEKNTDYLLQINVNLNMILRISSPMKLSRNQFQHKALIKTA